MRAFTTSNGTVIPAHLMQRVADRLGRGEDWQKVGTELLRDVIPVGEDDLSELNEVLTAAEDQHDAS